MFVLIIFYALGPCVKIRQVLIYYNVNRRISYIQIKYYQFYKKCFFGKLIVLARGKHRVIIYVPEHTYGVIFEFKIGGKNDFF